MLGAGAGDGDVDVGEQRLHTVGPAGRRVLDRLQPAPRCRSPTARGPVRRAHEPQARTSGSSRRATARSAAASRVRCRTTRCRSRCSEVSQRSAVTSMPPAKARQSSMTTIFWWCAAPTGWWWSTAKVEPVGSAAVEQHDRAHPGEATRSIPMPHWRTPISSCGLSRTACLEHAAEPVVLRPRPAARVQPDPGVEVPADEQHPPLGAQHRLLEGGEVVGRVDEDREPVRPLDPPARLAGDQHRRRPAPAGSRRWRRAARAARHRDRYRARSSPRRRPSHRQCARRRGRNQRPTLFGILSWTRKWPSMSGLPEAAAFGPGRVGLDAMQGRRRT